MTSKLYWMNKFTFQIGWIKVNAIIAIFLVLLLNFI